MPPWRLFCSLYLYTRPMTSTEAVPAAITPVSDGPVFKQSRIQGVDPEEAACRTWTTNGPSIMLAPSILSSAAEVLPGDLFCHITPSTIANQMWILRPGPNGILQWDPATFGVPHPIKKEYRLNIKSDHLPSWVTAKTMDTYAAQRRRDQGKTV